MIVKQKSLQELCASHRSRHYFDDGNGLVGVPNHRDVVLWYRWLNPNVGYSLVGETLTPQDSTLRMIERSAK